MRRAVPVLAATAGGLALLANFHTSPTSTGVVDPSADSGTSNPLAPAAPAGPASTVAHPSTSAPAAPTTSAVPTTVAGNTVVGPVTQNRWGEVQVRVVLSGTHIVDVQALRLPGDNSHSVALSHDAAPRLRQEALQAQSADIDLVSGATLTSQGYVESLQGALDQVGRR